jgi:uncharacterized membrane protein YphA (DoxX/SURF4 family)
MSAKMRRAPLRVVTGGYIVTSGLSKLNADEVSAKSMHSAASGTYSFLGNVPPKTLSRGLGVAEMAVGAAVLLPIVSPVVAGAALVGFSGAVLNMYRNTPGMHREGSPLPTDEGVPFAKDVVMLGVGIGLLADATLEPAHDKVVELEAVVGEKRAAKSRRARRKARKAARKTAAVPDYLKSARDSALELQSDAAKRAQKAAKKTQKRAEKASGRASKRLAEMRDEYGPVAADKARTARDVAKQAAEEYGPVAAEKARAARDTARQWAEEYGPVAADKARAARDVAVQAAEDAGAKVRERVS